MTYRPAHLLGVALLMGFSATSALASNFFDAKTVSAGGTHTCAINTDNELYCWGSPLVGDDTSNQSNYPVLVEANDGFTNTNVTAVAAGFRHTCAIEGGSVYCWGYGPNGQLGDGDAVDRLKPVKVKASNGFTNTAVTAVATSDGPPQGDYTCAIENKKLFCWGDLGQNAVPDLTSLEPKPLPVRAPFTNTDVEAVAIGGASACLIESGSVFCWGGGAFNELGFSFSVIPGDAQCAPANYNSLRFACLPVPIPPTSSFPNTNVTELSMGSRSACAIEGSKAFCWGFNNDGQLGVSSASTTPEPVAANDGFTNTAVEAISFGGSDHACAVESGVAYCWGLNRAVGNLGTGSDTSSTVPVKVGAKNGFDNSGNVTAINAGGAPDDGFFPQRHTCAVEDNELYCWGSNYKRQLAVEGLSFSRDPVRVSYAPVTYTLGGTVTGLAASVSLTLQNDPGSPPIGLQNITANGAFTFATPILENSNYDVTVRTQPSGQSCSVTNGSGTITANVTDITVSCLTSDPNAVSALQNYNGVGDAPPLSTYVAAGVQNATEDNRLAYASALSRLPFGSKDLAAIQAVVDTYNAIISSATSGTASSLAVADYTKVSVTAVQAAEALLNDAVASADAEGVETVDKLQAIADAAKTLTDLANATTMVNAPVLSDYALLGMTGLTEANLGSYNSAVFTKGASTSTAIQAAISAYNAVLAGAGQGQSATVTSQQYEDIAVTVTVIPTEVPLAGEVLSIVNSAVGTQAKEASDTVTELRRMAKGANTIIQTATDSSDAGLVEEDFSVLGIVGVREGNLPDVVTAVEGATASELTSVPAIKAELPSLSDPVSVAALAGFDGEGDAPNKAVYESAGVAGVDEANVASYNSALATLTIAEDDLDAIQDVVDAYNAILSAVGTTNTSTLGVADFEALGLSVPAASLPLLREAISDLEVADINAIAELSAVVGSATKLAGQADEAVTNEAPGAADYTAVGVSSVVAANVSAYNSAVEASGASTSSALQSVVTTINAIAAAANGNPATVPSLAVTDYAAIGVTVPGPSLGLVNSSVGSQGASASNTSTKLSAIVTAVNKILATVGTSGQSSGLTVADFAALGVVGVTDTNLDDAIVAIAAAEASDVQTLSAIQVLLSDVLITPLPVPTLSQWVLILMAALLLMVSAPLLRRS